MAIIRGGLSGSTLRSTTSTSDNGPVRPIFQRPASTVVLQGAHVIFDDIRQAIIDGLDSAQSEGTGWDAQRVNIPVTAVVRTSNTVVTITLPALPSYDITAPETITATVPASALLGGNPIVGTPTFTINVNSVPRPFGIRISGQAVQRAAYY